MKTTKAESKAKTEGSADTKNGTTKSGVTPGEKNGKTVPPIQADTKSDKAAIPTVEIPDNHLPAGMTLVGFRWIDTKSGTTSLTVFKNPDEVQNAIAALAKRWHPKKHEFILEMLVKSTSNEVYSQTPEDGWMFVEQLPT